MKFGAHAFIWEADYSDEVAEKLVSAAGRNGLDILELPLLNPDHLDPVPLGKLAADAGIELTYSLGLPTDKSLPDKPAEAEAFLRRTVDFAAATGSHTITGVLYGTLGELVGRAPTNDDYETIAEALASVARYAAEKGVALGLEPVNRYETYLVNTVEQGLRLIGMIGAENVFLHLDTYHMNIEEKGFRDPIRNAGRHIGYVHISESDRGTPGTGNVHWEEVFEGLRDVDYRGALVMESFVAVNKDIARATCMWRPVAPDSDTLVREGLRFLRELAGRYQLQ